MTGTMIIDHVGIAVRSIERSIEHWETAFGYRQVTEIVTNTRQKTIAQASVPRATEIR